MDSRYKRIWVSALRSGNFKQVRRSLKKFSFADEPPQCCVLGVAREILKASGFRGDCSNNFLLSAEEREELEIDMLDVTVIHMMNDGDKRTFNEIADWIEENL